MMTTLAGTMTEAPLRDPLKNRPSHWVCSRAVGAVWRGVVEGALMGSFPSRRMHLREIWLRCPPLRSQLRSLAGGKEGWGEEWAGGLQAATSTAIGGREEAKPSARLFHFSHCAHQYSCHHPLALSMRSERMSST